MGTVTGNYTFTPGDTVTYTKLNNLVANLLTEFNGSIENANIKANAQIAATKLNLATIAQNVAFTGTLDFSGATITAQTTFADLVATTADINAGTFDGVVGGTTPAAGTFTDLTSTGNTTIGDASGDALTINPSAWTLSNAVTVTGTWTDLGTVTTADINGGTLDGVQIGGTTATGEIIVNNATDDADGLGSQGTSGQFLTSAGAGANPTWTTMSQDFTLLSVTPVSDTTTSANITVENDKIYKVVFNFDATSNTDTTLGIRFNSSDGSEYGNEGEGKTASTEIDVNATAVEGEDNGGVITGEFTIMTVSTAGDRILVYGYCVYLDGSQNMQRSDIVGYWDKSVVLTDFEMFADNDITGDIFTYELASS